MKRAKLCHAFYSPIPTSEFLWMELNCLTMALLVDGVYGTPLEPAAPPGAAPLEPEAPPPPLPPPTSQGGATVAGRPVRWGSISSRRCRLVLGGWRGTRLPPSPQGGGRHVSWDVQPPTIWTGADSISGSQVGEAQDTNIRSLTVHSFTLIHSLFLF